MTEYLTMLKEASVTLRDAARLTPWELGQLTPAVAEVFSLADRLAHVCDTLALHIEKEQQEGDQRPAEHPADPLRRGLREGAEKLRGARDAMGPALNLASEMGGDAH